MDEATKRRIETAVTEILREADMETTTEYKVRKMASERLGLDLSPPDRKRLVRSVVESFLLSSNTNEANDDDSGNASAQQQQEEEEEEEDQREDDEEEEEETDSKSKKREYDDDGDLIVCRLSNKRKVTIQDFRGKTLVSIREFYEKDGKQLPTSKGISLTVEQWEAFHKAVPAIQDAIKKLED